MQPEDYGMLIGPNPMAAEHEKFRQLIRGQSKILHCFNHPYPYLPCLSIIDKTKPLRDGIVDLRPYILEGQRYRSNPSAPHQGSPEKKAHFVGSNSSREVQ